MARLGYKVTILEKSPKAGGLNRGGIPDWVLPAHVLDREIERLVELGVTIKTNVEVGKDVTWDDLKKNYDACVLAVGLTEPNSVRAEGENKDGVLYGLPFLRDIGMGTSKVKLGARVAVIGGGNTAIDCAREALRQGAVEVTMITVESNPQEMPCVPEDLHDMLEEGVELLHGRAMTAVLGNGKVEALQLYPARFSGAINASPITINREAPAERFAVDNVIIAIGQRASLGWLPAEFKSERGTIKIDRFGRLGDTNFFAAGDVVQLGSGQPLMVVNAVGDGKRVAFNLDKMLRGKPLQPRKIPVDVIMDLNRMNMTYFPHFPRVRQTLLPPVSRRKTQEEVIQGFTEEQVVEEASRCFSCGTCNACDNCYLVCPEPCIVRPARSNGLYKILVDYCKGCRVCIEECPDGLPRGRARTRLRYRRRANGHGIRHLAWAARPAGARADESGEPAGEGDLDGSGVRLEEALRKKLRCLRAHQSKYSPSGGLCGVNYGNELLKAKKKTVRINGCVASAQAAKYADVDVITAYPIRPYTATMMALAQMVANGELDAEYIVADSEHSQLSIAHGASSSGARVFTGSSGVGVQFAYELYSPISGSRMPVQMMIADRTLDPPGDFGSEHTDALSTRDMGWLMGWSCDAQEAFDNHLMAYRIGEDPRVLLPQMVCQDGFFVSHITS